MLKLVLCILCATLLAIVTLQLRQQNRNLNYQNNKLYGQIESCQAELWNQQLQIAMYTSPNAIAKTVGAHELNLVPPDALPARVANWIDVRHNPDAE
jgi:hypothetical protein